MCSHSVGRLIWRHGLRRVPRTSRLTAVSSNTDLCRTILARISTTYRRCSIRGPQGRVVRRHRHPSRGHVGHGVRGLLLRARHLCVEPPVWPLHPDRVGLHQGSGLRKVHLPHAWPGLGLQLPPEREHPGPQMTSVLPFSGVRRASRRGTHGPAQGREPGSTSVSLGKVPPHLGRDLTIGHFVDRLDCDEVFTVRDLRQA
jgi:hypothetical protein